MAILNKKGGTFIRENKLKRARPEKKKKFLLAFFLIALISTVCFSPHFRAIYALPLSMRIIEGETVPFSAKFPLTATLRQERADLQDEDLFSLPIITALKNTEPEFLRDTGTATVEFKLLGIIPLRTVQLDVLPAISLMPGGHSIGVVLHSQGVIVVGNSPVLTEDGRYFSPAKEAGLLVGDTLLSINGTPLHTDKQVADIIDANGQTGQSVTILVKRAEGQQNISVTPVLCNDTKRYRIGLFVRDSAAGVGTLTFYEKDSGIYGALGHIITDNDTNQPIDCDKGKIVLATVSGIQHGKKGHPGEKMGVFIEEGRLLGDITKNTQFGIYGHLSEKLVNNAYTGALPVASMSQVKLGSAQMLTVVDAQSIEAFEIEIEKINLQEFPDSKGLIIKVTDERLIEKTGGIVQGMSGSPIIQNGKIVGAVTHVFVHDPTLGYGCFMDWMLMESGIIAKKETLAKNLFSHKIDYPQNSWYGNFEGSLFFKDKNPAKS